MMGSVGLIVLRRRGKGLDTVGLGVSVGHVPQHSSRPYSDSVICC